MLPSLPKLHAGGGYRGPAFQAALKRALRQDEVWFVKRPDTARGFKVLPKRWMVERSIAWLNRCYRLAQDRENLNRMVLPFLPMASIRLMLRKPCGPR